MLLFIFYFIFLFISLIVVASSYIYICWTIVTNGLIGNLSLPIGVENIKTGAAV